MTQSQALSILKTGANVFLTGEPGSGKTHTINEYTAYLRGRGIEPAITASTGIAATHIGGMTIHSWSGIGIKTKLDKHDLNKIASSQYITKRVRRTKILIIEEVSMLTSETLSMVDAVCREIKESPEPFGGMQIVFAGDFFQLPPVVKRETENNTQTALLARRSLGEGGIEKTSARFAYDSPAWTEANPIVCYLTEQYRQDDSNFLAILSAIRRNAFGSDHLHQIETRKIDPFDFAQDQSRAGREINPFDFAQVFDSDHSASSSWPRGVAQTRGDQSRAIRLRAHGRGAGRGIEHCSVPDNVPKLFSHNADVDRINNEILVKLPGEPHVFTMSSQGPDVLVAALKKGCLSPETLSLKVGAAVMFTKNNPKEEFVNGTLGVIEGFNKKDGYPIVKTRSGRRIDAFDKLSINLFEPERSRPQSRRPELRGRRIAVEPMDWTVEENGKVRAQISQLPLRLAWAITVHKSQGMNLDEVVMDLSDIFEFGQGYVALSRVRRLSGLYILGWNERAFQVHPEILAKDETFRLSSSDVETTFSKISPAELQKKQDNFIAACGGKQKSTSIENSYVYGKKKKMPDTYSETLVLWNEGKTILQIAKERGFKERTIFDHIEKLVVTRKINRADLSRLLTPSLTHALPKIHTAFRELNSDRLSPVFEKLGGAYSYDELRIARMLLNGKLTQEIPTQSGFEKIREKHPNAYRPWDKAQDEKLRELFLKGSSVADLAKTFSRKRGAIRSRLVKLGLLKK